MEPIDSGTAFFMTAVAIIFDLIGLIPLAGTLVDFIAATTFGMWFAHHGYSLVHRSTFRFMITILAEFIPGIDMWFFWTMLVRSSISKQRAAATV